MRTKKSIGTKAFVLLLTVVLLIGCAVGGTLAWLVTAPKTVTNTFTAGNINIDLKETKTDFKMVPGNYIEKDPIITVDGGSEPCWLFVKVTSADANGVKYIPGSVALQGKTKETETFIEYIMADGWIPLTGVDGVTDVYYRKVSASDVDQKFHVLADDRVKVLDTVTKAMMDQVTATNAPIIIFTAYAVQSDNIDTAAKAWDQVPN